MTQKHLNPPSAPLRGSLWHFQLSAGAIPQGICPQGMQCVCSEGLGLQGLMHTDLLWISGAAPVLGDGITVREVGLVLLHHHAWDSHIQIFQQGWRRLPSEPAPPEGKIPPTTAQLLLPMARLQLWGWRR